MYPVAHSAVCDPPFGVTRMYTVPVPSEQNVPEHVQSTFTESCTPAPSVDWQHEYPDSPEGAATDEPVVQLALKPPLMKTQTSRS